MTAERKELLSLIADLSEHAPDLRFGQMVANLATMARGPQVESIWDCEDEEFIPAARRLVEKYRSRQESAV
jgi:hypothetical protein